MRRSSVKRAASKPSLSIWCAAMVSKLQQLAAHACEKSVGHLEKVSVEKLAESSVSRERSFDRSRSHSTSSHTNEPTRVFVVVRLPDLMADAAAHARGAATAAVCVAHSHSGVPARCGVFAANLAAAELGVLVGQSVEEVRMRHGKAVHIAPYAFDESDRLARLMVQVVCVHAQRAVVSAFNEVVVELRHRPGQNERRLRRFANQLASLIGLHTRCTTRLGFGATPLLASLAASVAQPNAAFGALTQSQLQSLFSKAPASALPTVGDKTASALHAHGIATCADLLEPTRLVAAHAAIGVTHTARLIALLHGADAFALFAPLVAPAPVTPVAPRQRTLSGALAQPTTPASTKRRLGLARPAPPSSSKRRAPAAVPITTAWSIPPPPPPPPPPPSIRQLPPAAKREAPVAAPQTAHKRQRAAAVLPAPEFGGANNDKLARLQAWLRGGECAEGEQLLTSFAIEMIAMHKLDVIAATVRRRSPRFEQADAIVQRHALALLRAHIALT